MLLPPQQKRQIDCHFLTGLTIRRCAPAPGDLFKAPQFRPAVKGGEKDQARPKAVETPCDRWRAVISRLIDCCTPVAAGSRKDSEDTYEYRKKRLGSVSGQTKRNYIMKARKLLQSQSGFTLMELLMVIVILGFLLGMLVPRLASVTGDAIDNVCDSNNKGIRYFTKTFLDQKGHLPNNMINLVNLTDGGYALPNVEDRDVDNGAETLAREFYVRNHPQLHTLTADEAEELISELGIATVRNLNDFDGSGHLTNDVPGTAVTAQAAQAAASGDDGRPLHPVTINTGIGVAMIGDIGTAPTAATWASGSGTDYPMGNPNWYGRIILGVGKDCELVTSGMIQAAALCPGGVQNADNVTYNHYCIILPRLATTAGDIETLLGGTPADANGYVLTFADSADTTSGEEMEVQIAAQESWEFDFTCPEGHKWPDNDHDEWDLMTIN
jgi:prepilin-type N-terminal cleavage/methylation domain-containing protein